MARKRKDKDEDGVKSPEFLKFEEFAKQVLSVPKTEIDQREREYKEGRSKSIGSDPHR